MSETGAEARPGPGPGPGPLRVRGSRPGWSGGDRRLRAGLPGRPGRAGRGGDPGRRLPGDPAQPLRPRTTDPGPEDLTAAEAGAIAEAFSVAGVRIWGVSGTFNAVHPDPKVRAAGIAGCRAVIARAPELGAEVVTLCTGTRDPDDMWRAHPDNASPAAWHDLRATLDELIPAAAAAGVRLGIEPELGNVVVDAAHADRLLTELGSDARHLAVVLDPANLLTPATLDRQETILRAAFELLGPAVAAVHAKDVAAPDADPASVVPGLLAAGTGAMDYDLVLELHAALPAPAPLIAQDLTAADARRVHDFLAAGAARAAVPRSQPRRPDLPRARRSARADPRLRPARQHRAAAGRAARSRRRPPPAAGPDRRRSPRRPSSRRPRPASSRVDQSG